ncbi:hypothetical protein [Flaviflexus ciconiae]|nr:hypothetical protein [Flaviflexus ciconiae]
MGSPPMLDVNALIEWETRMAETIRTTHVGSLPRPTALINENVAL